MRRVMIIPAAGTGSRLQRIDTPKLLVPVAGRPMIDHLLDRYRDLVERFFLIVAPSALARVKTHLAHSTASVSYGVQQSPTGMLDAIMIPRGEIDRSGADQVWITWCDQIGVHPRTVDQLARVGDASPGAAVVLPTISRAQPYTHLIRGAEGQIVGLLQRREGDCMPDVGESEMGLFVLSRDAYLQELPAFAAAVGPGEATAERNFAPFIPWIAGRAVVVTLPATDEMEAVGVNTPEELRAIEGYLQARVSQGIV